MRGTLLKHLKGKNKKNPTKNKTQINKKNASFCLGLPFQRVYNADGLNMFVSCLVISVRACRPTMEKSKFVLIVDINKYLLLKQNLLLIVNLFTFVY